MQQMGKTNRSKWKFLGSAITVALSLVAGAARAEPAPDENLVRAREHFNAGRLKEAAAGFRSLALMRPPSSTGETAANLYLDSASRLLVEEKSAEVANEVTGTAGELMDIYCPPKSTSQRFSICEKLPTVHSDLLRFYAEMRGRAADKGGPASVVAAQEAGDLYFSIWRLYGDAAKKRRPAYSRMDEVLYNAGLMYKLGGKAPESIRAFRLLAETNKGTRMSSLAARATERIASISMGIGEYEEAALWFERFARESPAEAGASSALSDAVVLRLALGQASEVDAAASLFSKLYGSKKPGDAAQIAFAVGAWHADRGDFKAAAQRLKASLPLIGQSAPLAVHIQARAALARSLAATGDQRGAEEHFRAIQMIFKDPRVIADRILGQSPELGERRLGQALTALGEAHFFFAERERAKASAIKLPAYRGPADLEALKKKLPEALGARRRAMEQAETAYIRILSIEPSPPPKWVVEAAAQVTLIHADFINEIRSIETALKKEKTSPKTALADVAGSLDPFFRRALAAAKTCEMYSIKFQTISEASRRCQAWLDENAPREHPKIEELAPRMGHIRQGATEVEAPLLDPRDGSAH